MLAVVLFATAFTATGVAQSAVDRDGAIHTAIYRRRASRATEAWVKPGVDWQIAVVQLTAIAPPRPVQTGFLDRSITLDGKTYWYQVYVPLDYTATKPWPIIVDLHGNTQQGNDALLPTRLGLGELIRSQRGSVPAICVFPQAAKGEFWEQARMQLLALAELDQVAGEFNIERAREYLTGYSMGAAGTYRLAYKFPNRFAAFATGAGTIQAIPPTLGPARAETDRSTNPFTAAPDAFAELAERIKGVPISIVHGTADTVVSIEQSRQLVAALKNAGATVRYTELTGVTHPDGVTKMWTPELVEWLLAQRRPTKSSQ
jgi:predicted peptidase